MPNLVYCACCVCCRGRVPSSPRHYGQPPWPPSEQPATARCWLRLLVRQSEQSTIIRESERRSSTDAYLCGVQPKEWITKEQPTVIPRRRGVQRSGVPRCSGSRPAGTGSKTAPARPSTGRPERHVHAAAAETGRWRTTPDPDARPPRQRKINPGQRDGWRARLRGQR